MTFGDILKGLRGWRLIGKKVNGREYFERVPFWVQPRARRIDLPGLYFLQGRDYLYRIEVQDGRNVYIQRRPKIRIDRAPIQEANKERPLIQRIAKSMAAIFMRAKKVPKRILHGRFLNRWRRRTFKLLLCLIAVASLVFLSWTTYYLLQRKENPVWGSDSVWYVAAVVGGLAILFWSAKLIRSYRCKKTAPSFKLVSLSLLVIVIVLAFAGIEPLHDYKDRLINAAEDRWEQWQEEKELATQQGIAEQEREVNNLINEERAKRGLRPAVWSEQMHLLAKDQSDKMAQQRRLFHSNRYALEGGENAWGGESGHHWTPRDIVNSWMGSPRHRAWVLDPRVRIAGVGISHSDGGMYAAWAFSD